MAKMIKSLKKYTIESFFTEIDFLAFQDVARNDEMYLPFNDAYKNKKRFESLDNSKVYISFYFCLHKADKKIVCLGTPSVYGGDIVFDFEKSVFEQLSYYDFLNAFYNYVDKSGSEVFVRPAAVESMESALASRSAAIKALKNDISTKFILLGKELSDLQVSIKFDRSVWGSFDVYCKSEFDFSKSTVYNLINIYQLFYDNITAGGKYAEYNYTQLVEMLPLVGTEHEAWVTPDKHIEEIKAYKRQLKAQAKGTEKVKRKTDDRKPVFYSFTEYDEVYKFLIRLDCYVKLGEVEALRLRFYRLYMSDGAELIAQEVEYEGATRKQIFFQYVRDGVYLAVNADRAAVASMIINNGLSLSDMPYENKDLNEVKKAS